MQVLTEGMSLYRSVHSFHIQPGLAPQAYVCSSCADALKHHTMPALSLANGVSIGDIPLILWVLTLPGRILVACYFPAAYIVKLYPMKRGARSWSVHGLHSGLQGNVSTYCLNTDDIVAMTDTQIMPLSSAILAATDPTENNDDDNSSEIEKTITEMGTSNSLNDTPSAYFSSERETTRLRHTPLQRLHLAGRGKFGAMKAFRSPLLVRVRTTPKAVHFVLYCMSAAPFK